MSVADVTVALQQSAAYQVVAETNRPEWLAYCAKLPIEDTTMPGDDLEWSCLNGLEPVKAREVALERLNRYGIVSGSNFVTKRSTLKPAIRAQFVFACYFYGEERRNSHRLELTVQRDNDGQRISKRQRNRTNHKLGCEVTYTISYRARLGVWIGKWLCRPEEHTRWHSFPHDPTAWLDFKRDIPPYQELESIGQRLRSSRIPYRQARKMFSDEGVGMLMTGKEHYNLARRFIRDISDQDTPGALIAVFQQANWKYCFRTLPDGRQRKIVQIFFWNDRTRQSARHYCANSLLIADGTFRTNNKGLILLVAVGASSTGKTFPVAFSWVREEDAECYTEFFECLKEQIFDGDTAMPAVVITDLSSGMTSSHDKHNCLPGSQLQYCYWHALEAMKKWFRNQQYTSDEVDVLCDAAKQYLRSSSVDGLDTKRQALISLLMPGDRHYITQTWQARELRLVECYVQQYANLGYRTTQRGESFNQIIHKFTDHQMSLRTAAQGLINYVTDFYRDFEQGLTTALVNNIPGLPCASFRLLRQNVTLQALELLRDQWRVLSKHHGYLDKQCTGTFRKQYSLPCAHDLQQLYHTGEPIPRSMVHPRWWIEEIECALPNWQPSLIQTTAELPIKVTERESSAGSNAQAIYESMIDSLHTLEGDDLLRANTVLTKLLGKAKDAIDRRVEQAPHPLGSPDPVARFTKRLPTANERLDRTERARQMAAKAAEKEAQIQAKDTAILAARDLQEDDEGIQFQGKDLPQSQASIGSTIVVRPRYRTPPPATPTSPLPSSPDPLPEEEEEDTIPQVLPFASTAPIQGEGKRKRAASGYWAALHNGKRR